MCWQSPLLCPCPNVGGAMSLQATMLLNSWRQEIIHLSQVNVPLHHSRWLWENSYTNPANTTYVKHLTNILAHFWLWLGICCCKWEFKLTYIHYCMRTTTLITMEKIEYFNTVFTNHWSICSKLCKGLVACFIKGMRSSATKHVI